MQEVVAGLSGKLDKLYAEGLHVAGERYVLTKAEERSLYARKVDPSNFRSKDEPFNTIPRQC